MISLKIVLYPDGCLKLFKASGHARAGYKKGEDIVCASVTALLRTCAKLLSMQTDLITEGDAPEPGEMYLILHNPPADRIEWIRGITDFLLSGLKDLKSEYADFLRLDINGKIIGED